MQNLTWLTSSGSDLVSFAVASLLLIGYHLFLRYKLRENPAYSIQAVNVMARTAWVEEVMQGGKDILAVQTLRNSTMAATFLASTAVLLIIGVLTLTGQSDKLVATWHVLNVAGTTVPEMWFVKLMVLLLNLFVAFFSFTTSIRIFNHVGYMINVPLALNHRVISPRHVAEQLNRAGMYYSVGMRAYYFTVPLVFWLFGPQFLLVSSVALVFVLFYLDRTPRVVEEDYR